MAEREQRGGSVELTLERALSMLPAIAFFGLAQRRIVGGLSGLAGSVKG